MNIFQKFWRWVWCAWQNHPFTETVWPDQIREGFGKEERIIFLIGHKCNNCGATWYTEEDIES
jgi:hypothetical protein